jgi:hypothetical protein
VPLLSKVVPHLLCERCYRQLITAPHSVNADTIQSTGVVALPSHIAPMSAEQVKFTEVLNITQGVDGAISYDGAEVNGAETSAAPREIDFALFDRNLSVLLKGQDNKDVHGGKSGAAQAQAVPAARVEHTAPAPTTQGMQITALDAEAADSQGMPRGLPAERRTKLLCSWKLLTGGLRNSFTACSACYRAVFLAVFLDNFLGTIMPYHLSQRC